MGVRSCASAGVRIICRRPPQLHDFASNRAAKARTQGFQHAEPFQSNIASKLSAAVFERVLVSETWFCHEAMRCDRPRTRVHAASMPSDVSNLTTTFAAEPSRKLPFWSELARDLAQVGGTTRFRPSMARMSDCRGRMQRRMVSTRVPMNLVADVAAMRVGAGVARNDGQP